MEGTCIIHIGRVEPLCIRYELGKYLSNDLVYQPDRSTLLFSTWTSYRSGRTLSILCWDPRATFLVYPQLQMFLYGTLICVAIVLFELMHPYYMRRCA